MDNKNEIMKAYFGVENWLYGEGKNKPLEIKSAILWGALKTAKNSGAIDWDTMRMMYGEYMSKAMGLN